MSNTAFLTAKRRVTAETLRMARKAKFDKVAKFWHHSKDDMKRFASMKPYVILSIDSCYRPRDLEDTLLKEGYTFKQLRGSWEGVVENSWLVHKEALPFILHAIVDQRCILTVSSCNKQYCSMIDLKDGMPQYDTEVALGSLCAVSPQEAIMLKGWTLDVTTGVYYTAREGNPDIIPPPNGWPSKELLVQLHALIYLAEYWHDPKPIIDFVKEEYGLCTTTPI